MAYLDENGLEYVLDKLSTEFDKKSNTGHTHDDRYYTESEIDSKLSGKSDTSHTHDASKIGFDDNKSILVSGSNVKQAIESIDAALDNLSNYKASTSHGHKVADITDITATATELNYMDGVTSNVQTQLNGKVPTTRTVNGKALSSNITLSASDVGADAAGSASSALASAKTYADSAASSAATTVKNDLLNGAGAAYDTLKELGDLISANDTAIDALETVAAGKADKSHTHSNYASTVTTTGSGNAITAISQSGNTITATKGSTFSVDGHKHSAADITSGTLGVARGGTGVTSNPSMLVNLGSTSAASVFATSPRPGITGTLPIANGGTGATSASAARTNLSVYSKAEIDSAVDSKANKATTISGYGITDAYTKAQVDAKVATKAAVQFVTWEDGD